MKKIWDAITSVLVALVVIFAIFLMGSRLVGMQVFNVISGSMEPTYSVGDLLYVKSVDPDSVKVGDPITFVLNEDLVVATHRVVKVDRENRQFTTKGDANETEDASPVHFNNLVGIPVFSVPLLGYVSGYIQSPPGMYVAIAVGVLLLAAVFLPDLFTKKSRKYELKYEQENFVQKYDQQKYAQQYNQQNYAQMYDYKYDRKYDQQRYGR